MVILAQNVTPPVGSSESSYIAYVLCLILIAMFIYLARRDTQVTKTVSDFNETVKAISKADNEIQDKQTAAIGAIGLQLQAVADVDNKNHSILSSLDIRFDGIRMQLTDTQQTLSSTIEEFLKPIAPRLQIISETQGRIEQKLTDIATDRASVKDHMNAVEGYIKNLPAMIAMNSKPNHAETHEGQPPVAGESAAPLPINEVKNETV